MEIIVTQTPDDTDLLVQFERDNIKDDYCRFYAVKRNNYFSTIQSLPEHWEFFCRIDEIWRREIGDLEVSVAPDDMLPLVLYMNAHVKMRLSMELAFSICMPEGRSILRDAVENVAHAHHMKRDPKNQMIWLQKDEPEGRKAYKKCFDKNKKNGLFANLSELHEKYSQLSEAGSHPTMQSLANRLVFETHDGKRHAKLNYSGAPDRRLFAIELFSRLLTCYVMERTFFETFPDRLQLDPRLMQMRVDFEVFKENLRRTLIHRYEIKPPSNKPFQV